MVARVVKYHRRCPNGVIQTAMVKVPGPTGSVPGALCWNLFLIGVKDIMCSLQNTNCTCTLRNFQEIDADVLPRKIIYKVGPSQVSQPSANLNAHDGTAVRQHSNSTSNVSPAHCMINQSLCPCPALADGPGSASRE